MEKKKSYFGEIISAIGSLTTGLGITGKEFFTPKITECYPENRETLYMFDRFRGVLEMPHDEEGQNKCIACGLCQTACPNDTIRVTAETVVDEETGKKKKQLVKYEYDLGSCMYCNLCVEICPTGAIDFNNEFESSVFDRSILNMTLNALQRNKVPSEKKKEPETDNVAEKSEDNTEKTI